MNTFVSQFTFASNAATILGGCLVTNTHKLRVPAVFISAFIISVSRKFYTYTRACIMHTVWSIIFVRCNICRYLQFVRSWLFSRMYYL